MPFKSRAQAGWMFENHPKMAQEFAAETPEKKKLPYKVGGGLPTPAFQNLRKMLQGG